VIKIKILQIYQLFPPAKGYGPLENMFNISKELVLRGYEIHVLTSNLLTPKRKIKDFKKVEIIENIKVHRLSVCNIGNYFFTPHVIKFLYSHKFDIIHLHGLRNFFS